MSTIFSSTQILCCKIVESRAPDPNHLKTEILSQLLR